MRALAAVAIAMAASTFAARASAATAEARDKNGDRLAVSTTSEAVFAAVCPKAQKATCEAETGLRINPPASAKGALGKARARAVILEDGRAVVEVLIGEPSGRAYLVLVAPTRDQGPKVVFAGWIGSDGRTYAAQPGARGERLVLETSARHCGASVLLSRQTVDPKTLTLEPMGAVRLPADARPAVDLASAASSPSGKLRLLEAHGASTGSAALAVDGDLSTAWEGPAKGSSVGEFLLLSAPREAEVSGLDVHVRAPSESEQYAPESLLVHTDKDVFRIALPADARKGGWFGVSFPQGKTARCFSIEVERAAQAKGSRVAIAEVSPRTAFSGTAESLAAGLGADPKTVEKRTRLLVALGDEGTRAVAAAYPTLDAATRDAVRRVIDALGCDTKLAVYVPLLASTDREEEGRARDRIRRCGKEAFDALARSFGAARGEPRARFAEEASLLDPARAVPLLVDALVSAESVGERRLLRKALAKASGREASTPAFEALFAGEAFGKLPMKSKIEVFRAAIARLAQTPSARAALEGTTAEATGFRERYLLLPAIAEVAKSSDAPALRTLEALIADRNPHLRARAIEVARGVAPTRALVLARSRDPEPRVREAAMRSVDGTQLSVTDLRALTGTLRAEPWTFVKRAGVSVTVSGPRDATVDESLGELIEWTDAPEVRGEALVALGARRGATQLARIVSRAKDEREILPVRLRAVEALGKLCVDEALDPLTELVEKGADSSFEADIKVAALAVAALAALGPADLDARLESLVDPDAPLDLNNLARKALADRRKNPARAACK